jgi:hypothetical protein
VAHTSLDQAHAVDAVVDQIAERQAHALAHLGKCCEVEHRVPRPIGQNRLHNAGIRQVRNDQLDAGWHGRAVPGAQIVEHHDGVAARGEGSYKMAADITGSAGDQIAPRHCLPTPGSSRRGAEDTPPHRRSQSARGR